jgi:hypothetical protein
MADALAAFCLRKRINWGRIEKKVLRIGKPLHTFGEREEEIKG